ncbi:mechanosensitive ion channel family protein [Shewanella intestini]|uniref:Small-conductance mechanosensitive channel n=1 Tax=Shewanella intestini TaxID=2017544 RepID=A0ABS5I0N6_9GAMM|nr:MULTISPECIES: mechanosensitive ion channel family protein [Shewanella]MBR9727587.1 mechanosensitive ion channel family protein [Shewanella intestini]MRG35263.1 mechanosensitive ion channel [Shewanella sp. XMDDZSB0408]
MLRILLSCLLILSNMSVVAHAANTTDSSPAPAFTQTDKQRVANLEHLIDVDLVNLTKAKGELIPITEYRIKNKTKQLRAEIRKMLNVDQPDIAYLKPLVAHQLTFLTATDQYLANKLAELENALGGDNDDATLLAISDREYLRDHFLKAQLNTYSWAEKVGIDVSEKQSKMKQFLIARADRFESLTHYTHARLKAANQALADAGADATSEQKALVSQLNTRLEQSSSSLQLSADLMEKLGLDTTKLRQTLFNISGDITQDVLNIDLATGLLQQWGKVITNHALKNGPSFAFKLFIFCLILFITSLVAKLATRLVSKTVSASKLNFSKLLQDFFISLSSKTVFALGLLIALSQLGFELGPLLAGFGIAGVIIGFALQDTLSNFASGMMILIYRPYDVGDLINAAGVTGKVSHMSLVSTTIKTLDNQRLIIPNNKIWGDTINNITAEHLRRVDMVFGISYSDNIEHAEKVLADIISKHELIRPEPEPMIKLHTLNESSVDFIVRPWVRPEHYWDVYWDITRAVKIRFDEEGISIPFPQRDVHVYQTNT